MKAVIALGSNIEPEKNIQRARTLLKETFEVVQESSFVRTKPVGYTNQPDFINGCVLIETRDALEKIKERLKGLEAKMGRAPSAIKCGPRNIDLDLVTFNGTVTDTDFYSRDFLKQAVLELLPELQY